METKKVISVTPTSSVDKGQRVINEIEFEGGMMCKGSSGKFKAGEMATFEIIGGDWAKWVDPNNPYQPNQGGGNKDTSIIVRQVAFKGCIELICSGKMELNQLSKEKIDNLSKMINS